MFALAGTSRALAIDPPASDAAPESGALARIGIDRANQALRERRYEEAGKIIEEVLAMPEFPSLTPNEQYAGVSIAGYCAMKRHDPLEAHDYFVALTSFEFADLRAWKYRAQTASQIEDWSDTLLALTAAAKRWPDKLGGSAYDDWLIDNAVHQAAPDPKLRGQRLELLNAMFDGGYTRMYGEQPSQLWVELAAEALQGHDLARAREVSTRITSSASLIQLRIDRRFDELVAAEPALLDVRGAAMRQKQRFATQVASNPRNLELVTRYCDALYTLGDFKEMLKVSSTALDKVARAPKESPPYDDLNEWLGWTYNIKSTALSGLGRTEEGAQILADWRTDPRNTQSKVSQAINLGAIQNQVGKPEEALRALEGIDWVKGLSTYGRLQFQEVRLDAYLQLGHQDEADTVLAWFHEHQQESPATAQLVFLKAGDLDAAAAVLVARLENPDTRAEALASLQEFKSRGHSHAKPSEHQLRLKTNYGKLYSRADVLAAIGKYGRIETFPVYNSGR